MQFRNVMTAGALAALLGGCAQSSTVADGGPADPPRTPTTAPTSAPDSPALPEGWRWESYRDLELAVPADWSHSGGGIPDWCADTSRDKSIPGVGRPTGTLSILCPQAGAGEPDPGSLIRNGGTYVNFVAGADEDLKDEGDRIVLRRGELAVVIQAPKQVRDRIAATVHTNVGSDAAGCPLDHPLGDDRTWRPATGVAVKELTDADRVMACKYALPRGGGPGENGAGPDLISSLVLEGSTAQDSMTAIAGAPAGGGPNRPQNCSEESSYGGEAIALLVTRAEGEVVTVVLRYDGCVAAGFDDGTEIRTLARASVTPFIGGPNRPNSFQGNKARILIPK